MPIHQAFNHCLNHLGARLAALPTNCLLNNGNVERELKFLTAYRLETLAGGFSYVMEKTLPAGGRPIDLIAFQNLAAVFAAEFKCTFSNDTPLRVIKKACDQAIAIRGQGFPDPSGVTGGPVPVYIIHFLNHSDPANLTGSYPQWIRNKYPKGKKRKGLVDLEGMYRQILGAGPNYYPFHHYPNLDWLVIELV